MTQTYRALGGGHTERRPNGVCSLRPCWWVGDPWVSGTAWSGQPVASGRWELLPQPPGASALWLLGNLPPGLSSALWGVIVHIFFFLQQVLKHIFSVFSLFPFSFLFFSPFPSVNFLHNFSFFPLFLFCPPVLSVVTVITHHKKS